MTASRGTGPVEDRAPAALVPVSGSNAPSLGVREPTEAPSPSGGRTGPRACRVCGRALKRPSPSGIGPVCQRKASRPAPHILTPRPDHHVDGQEELPLVHLQPTLWSL